MTTMVTTGNTTSLATFARPGLTTRKLSAGCSTSRVVSAAGRRQGRRLIVTAQKKPSGGKDKRPRFLRFLDLFKPAEVSKPVSPSKPAKPTTKQANVKQPAAPPPAPTPQKAAAAPATAKPAKAASPPPPEKLSGVEKLMANNNEWAKAVAEHDPELFPSLAAGQAPEFLWIGCSDSRVVPNLATSMKPGDIFVHRNVGNIVMHSDMNCMSALEFSIHALGVKHVIVCGHYGCGAVKAAMTLPQKSDGVTNCWINPIREVRNYYAEDLKKLNLDDQQKFICEANAIRQAFNACTAPPVQKAWANDMEVYVHAVIFDLASGQLTRLAGPISSLEQASKAEMASAKHVSTIKKDLGDVLAFEQTM